MPTAALICTPCELVGDVLDRRGVDVVPAADDQILLAPGQDEPGVLR